MSTHFASPEAARRRSERLLLQIPVVVCGKTGAQEPFRERTRTLVVNAHGALIAMATPVAMQQVVAVENVATGTGRESRVVFFGGKKDGMTSVGVEFVAPDPDFWNIEFTPVNWRGVD